MKDCTGCSRRSVLQGIGITTLGTLLFGGCQQGGALPTATTTSCGSGVCIDTSDAANSALATPGGAMIVDMGGDSVAVIRMTETQVVALSAICTHAGCEMSYDDANHRMDCGCHGSLFSLDGQVIQGPANRPVKVYKATLAQNVITLAP